MSEPSARGRLVIASEQRLDRQHASCISLDIDALGRPYAPLCSHFGAVTVVARGAMEDRPVVIDGGGVRVELQPDFRGLRGIIWHGMTACRAAWKSLGDASLVVVPVPSFATLPIWLAAQLRRTPSIVHVVGDAGEVPGSIGMPVPRLWSRLAAALSRWQVRRATGVWHVTRDALQQAYPQHQLTVTASNVSITDEWFCKPRERREGEVCRMAFVGALERRYKGLDVLLQALSRLDAGRQWKLEVVGDGALQHDLIAMARDLGVADRLTWRGQLSRDQVRMILQTCHVFVMPSLTEGLPRAMVEAMACGLACIGSEVGGIPELLPPAAMVEPGNPASLASVIDRLLIDEEYRLRSAQGTHQASSQFARQGIDSRVSDFAVRVRKRLAEGP